MTVNLINYSLDPEYIEAGTEGSYGIEKLTVVPDESWDGLDLSVVFFMPDDTLIKISLPEDNTVEIPQEITLSGGEYKFAVVGVNSSVQKVSVSGTIFVLPGSSLELLEVPVDKISPAFADFLLLYHEMNEIADKMKVELFFDAEQACICWRYAGTEEKHTLVPTENLSLSARFDGTKLVVTTPVGELEPVNLKGSSWYCGKAVFLPSEQAESVYYVSADSLSEDEAEIFASINTADMYVCAENGDIYRCTSPCTTENPALFERACSVSEFVGAKRIDMGVTPDPQVRFLASTEAVVYLDNSGSDANSGSTADAPVKYLSTAISKLPAAGGCICIVEKYSAESPVTLNHTGRIVLRGLTSESVLETKSIILQSDLSVENITVKPLSEYTFFNAGGHSLALLSGITCLANEASGLYPSLRGGSDSVVESGKGAVISIFSGTYNAVYAGGRNTMYCDGIVEIYGDGASFKRVCPGSDGSYDMLSDAYFILNNVTKSINFSYDSSAAGQNFFTVKTSGGYCFFDREAGNFVFHAPANGLVTPASGESYIASPGVISIDSDTVIDSIAEWDFSLCKEAILSLGTDCTIYLKNAPVGSTGTVTVTDGLINNYPKQGLDRTKPHIYTVSVLTSGEVWTCREA